MRPFSIVTVFGVCAALSVSACKQSSTSSPPLASEVGEKSTELPVTHESTDKQSTPMVADFTIESPVFGPGKSIAIKYSAEGANKPPPLTSKAAPLGTESYALVAVDADAARGAKTHWVLWDIPANSAKLDEAVGTKGRNDFGVNGWTGPEPTTGNAPHHYIFRLYALDVPTLGLSAGEKRGDLERAVKGHVLGIAETTGLYEHP